MGGRACLASMSNLESPARRKWRELLVRQRGSGLSVAEFCRRHRVPASSFFAWKRRLPEMCAPPAFVEAKISDASRGAGQTSGGGPAGGVEWADRLGRAGKIEIRLRRGRRLLVSRGFDRDLLAEVVAVLEGLS